MRDRLPAVPWTNESAIVNLDSHKSGGSHWVAYKKHGREVLYYDSFGDLRPPLELIRYFRGCSIKYNYEREQEYNTSICGHLCLNFLHN